MRPQAIDTSFRVDPAELDTFAEGVRRLAATMERHVQTFESLELDSGVFGRLPGVSDKVYDSYHHHLAEGVTAFAEGRSVLTSAMACAERSAGDYRAVERANVALIEELRPMINPRRRRTASEGDQR